jgi:ATP-binding cassette subfamily F protein 3
MLGAFLFRGDDVFKSISVLSGGEKSRIALLELLLRPVNLLVLDEPTNHLDMHSKDVLLEALKDFGGTVIFVSHDRGFIEGLATRVLELTGDGEHDGHWRIFPGDYVYYQERLEAEAQGLIVSVNKATQENVGSATKLSWEEQKKQQSERRKIEREVERLEKEIALAEEEKKGLEEELSRPEVYSDGAKSKNVQEKIDQVRQSIDQLTQKWEAAAEQLA